jgi:hypothetical protein
VESFPCGLGACLAPKTDSEIGIRETGVGRANAIVETGGTQGAHGCPLQTGILYGAVNNQPNVSCGCTTPGS